VAEIELGLIVFCAFDYWIDDVGLALLRYLFADELPHFVRTLVFNATGDDGGAAGRQFVKDAEVKVAVE
jgi:hypothetical protein